MWSISWDGIISAFHQPIEMLEGISWTQIISENTFETNPLYKGTNEITHKNILKLGKLMKECITINIDSK
jgi:hypothetical protein